MTACCIFPVTAAALMLYQTKFYDYQWIWSVVPVTAVIACGAVGFLAKYKYSLKLTVLLLGILSLCGSLGSRLCGDANGKQAQDIKGLLTCVREEMQEEAVCLWAPSEILEYARETDPSIKLLYGRNMWDQWLNAYAYDVYSEDLEELYLWMEETAASGTCEDISGYVADALAAGANCILLPESLEEGIIKGMDEELNVRVIKVEGYYLLRNRSEITL